MKQVDIRRSKLKSKLAKMKRKSRKQNEELFQQIMNVRASIAGKLGKAYKKGNEDNCKCALKDEDSRLGYCSKNFPADFDTFNDCKSEEDFCTFCCEHEFGDVFIQEKQRCIENLCSSKKGNPAGRWVWEKPEISPIKEELSDKNGKDEQPQ